MAALRPRLSRDICRIRMKHLTDFLRVPHIHPVTEKSFHQASTVGVQITPRIRPHPLINSPHHSLAVNIQSAAGLRE